MRRCSRMGGTPTAVLGMHRATGSPVGCRSAHSATAPTGVTYQQPIIMSFVGRSTKESAVGSERLGVCAWADTAAAGAEDDIAGAAAASGASCQELIRCRARRDVVDPTGVAVDCRGPDGGVERLSPGAFRHLTQQFGSRSRDSAVGQGRAGADIEVAGEWDLVADLGLRAVDPGVGDVGVTSARRRWTSASRALSRRRSRPGDGWVVRVEVQVGGSRSRPWSCCDRPRRRGPRGGPRLRCSRIDPQRCPAWARRLGGACVGLVPARGCSSVKAARSPGRASAAAGSRAALA